MVEISVYRLVDSGRGKKLFILTSIKGKEYLVSLEDGTAVSEAELVEYGWEVHVLHPIVLHGRLEALAEEVHEQELDKIRRYVNEEDVPF